VAPSGADTNAGSAAAPFATIGKAASLAQAGDTVWIAGGDYRETVRPAASGTDASPITFRSWDSGARARLNGTDVVAGPWTQVGTSGVYWASWVGDYTSAVQQSDQIFVDGAMLNLLRWPKETNNNLTLPREAAIDAITITHPQSTVTDSEWDQPDGRWTGAKVWVNLSNQYDGQGQSGSIVSTSLSAKQIVWTGIDTRGGEGAWGVRAGTAYYLFDPTPEALAATGGIEAALGEKEWWLDRTARRLYVRLAGGADPSAHRVEAKRRDWGFDLVDRSFITVRDLDLFATSITTDPDPKWQNMGATVAAATGILIDGLQVDYVTHFTDQTGDYQVQWAGQSGIVLSGRGHTLRNCVFRWSAGSGVSVVGEDHRVYNNLFESMGYLVVESGAINTGKWSSVSRDHKIGFNTIRDSASLGISIRRLSNSDPEVVGVARVHHNQIFDVMHRMYDAGGVDWVGVDGQWVRVDHNLIHGMPEFLQFGIYPDYGAGGDNGVMRYQIDHNVVFDAWSPIGGNSFREIRINNNVALNTTQPHTYMPSGISTQNGSRDNIAVEVYNNISSGSLDSVSKGTLSANLTGSVSSLAPLFVDPSNADPLLRDYALKASATTAIDKGVAVTPWDDPVVNGAPDIGAYEYGRTKWKAGYGAVPWYLDDQDTLRVAARESTLVGAVVLHPFAALGPVTGLTVSGASAGVTVQLAATTAVPDDPLGVAVTVGAGAPLGTGWFELEGTLSGGAAHRQAFSFEVLPAQSVASIQLTGGAAEPWQLAPGQIFTLTATAYDAAGQPFVSQPVFTWAVTGGGTIDPTGNLTTATRQGGPYVITVSAGGVTATQLFRVATDWARIGALSDSSELNSTTLKGNAVDDSLTTLWVSNASDPQWLRWDLGEPVMVDRVELLWHTANFGRDYAIEISTDGTTWQRLRLITGSTSGGAKVHEGLNGPAARYVQVLGLARPSGTAWACLGKVDTKSGGLGVMFESLVFEGHR
jgi:hypothetical protein